MRNYVTYVLSQFRERGATEVTLRQMGREIDKIVTVAEIIKYRVKGLYQINKIGSQLIEDSYEPTEEGQEEGLNVKRNVTFFTITLTKTQPQKGVVYQEPIDESLVDESQPIPRENFRTNDVQEGGYHQQRERRELRPRN